MILMDSRFKKTEKKEEDDSHHKNHQPDPRKGAEELKSGSKSNPSFAGTGASSSPPSVFGSMNTPTMQKPTKFLLQQPATQPPPFCPLIPTSQLLFPGLPRLETEGLKIFDPEPILPFPGEPQNWSHYGVYLQTLSAYNATGTKFLANPKITKESKRLEGQGTAKPGSEQEKEKTVAKSKEGLKRTNDKRKGKALTEQQKVKQRDYYKKWYERNKDKLKGRIIVLTEEQKVKQRAYYKQWYQRNKGKRKLTERQSK